MTSITFFFLFIPLLAFILLGLNLLLAPRNPYQEKDSTFECGFHSFLGQNRTQFSISFFIFALLFLLFDLEILLVYPYVVSSYTNGIYGLVIMLIFFLALSLGFAFELGKNALKIDSRQMFILFSKEQYLINIVSSLYKQYIGVLLSSCLEGVRLFFRELSPIKILNIIKRSIIFRSIILLLSLIFYALGISVKTVKYIIIFGLATYYFSICLRVVKKYGWKKLPEAVVCLSLSILFIIIPFWYLVGILDPISLFLNTGIIDLIIKINPYPGGGDSNQGNYGSNPGGNGGGNPGGGDQPPRGNFWNTILDNPKKGNSSDNSEDNSSKGDPNNPSLAPHGNISSDKGGAAPLSSNASGDQPHPKKASSFLQTVLRDYSSGKSSSDKGGPAPLSSNASGDQPHPKKASSFLQTVLTDSSVEKGKQPLASQENLVPAEEKAKPGKQSAWWNTVVSKSIPNNEGGNDNPSAGNLMPAEEKAKPGKRPASIDLSEKAKPGKRPASIDLSEKAKPGKQPLASKENLMPAEEKAKPIKRSASVDLSEKAKRLRYEASEDYAKKVKELRQEAFEHIYERAKIEKQEAEEVAKDFPNQGLPDYWQKGAPANYTRKEWQMAKLWDEPLRDPDPDWQDFISKKENESKQSVEWENLSARAKEKLPVGVNSLADKTRWVNSWSKSGNLPDPPAAVENLMPAEEKARVKQPVGVEKLMPAKVKAQVKQVELVNREPDTKRLGDYLSSRPDQDIYNFLSSGPNAKKITSPEKIEMSIIWAHIKAEHPEFANRFYDNKYTISEDKLRKDIYKLNKNYPKSWP